MLPADIVSFFYEKCSITTIFFDLIWISKLQSDDIRNKHTHIIVACQNLEFVKIKNDHNQSTHITSKG